MKFVIEHDRENCIGCGACAAICPDMWEMTSDGKSSIIGGKKTKDGEMLETDDVKCSLEAAQSCPVNVIHIKESGKKIV